MTDSAIQQKNTSRFEPFAAAFVCILAAFIVYSSALSNAFLFDDSTFLAESREWIEGRKSLFSLRPFGYFRPVWSAYVGILESVFGLNPVPYFIFGILIHGFNGFVIYCIARKIELSRAASWVAALLFITFFSHSEATLWMASHNSSLCAGFCALALLTHITNIKDARYYKSIATGILVLLALFTKETGITVVGWLVVADVSLRGPRGFLRRLMTRAAAVRYSCILAALGIFILTNDRFYVSLRGEQWGTDSMAGLGNITIARVLGAFPILYSPIGTVPGATFPWTGAALFAGFSTIVLIYRKIVIKTGLFAFAIAAVALLPVCTTMFQHHASSRLYYFPTFGAALMAGVIADVAFTKRWGAAAFMILTLVFAAVSMRSIVQLNELYYKPFSQMQTESAQSVRPFFSDTAETTLHLIDPPIDNIMHLRNFLVLYFGIPWEWVAQSKQPATEFAAWADAERAKGAAAIGWIEGKWTWITGPPPPSKPALRAALSLSGPAFEPSEELSIYTIYWKPD
ncbi:MAG: hypothetical protein ACKVS6_07575 [Planctomycetota bacterium]